MTAKKVDTPVLVQTPNEENEGKTPKVSVEAVKPRGLQVAEATTQAWDIKTLVMVYVVMSLVQFVQEFAGGFTTALTPFVTSAFKAHSLTATTGIIAALAAGLVKLPYAKLLDVFGRAEALVFATVSQTIGLILLAASTNVETYCAGQVFFQMGLLCILFTQVILVVDTSKPRHRAFALGVISLPSMATAWITGPAAQSVLRGIGWRWGLGILAIVCPLSSSILIILLFVQNRRAIKKGLVTLPEKSGEAALRGLGRLIIDWDLPGILTLLVGLALFLLSFNLWTFQSAGWRSPLIICFIIIGGLLIISFAVYEWRFARVPFLQWSLLKSRTVAGTYLFAITNFIGYEIWGSFFYSMLIVAWNQSITNTTYILNITTVGAAVVFMSVGCLFLVFPKLRIKWLTFCVALPFMLLALGLLYHFRYDSTGVRFVIMTQVLYTVGGGMVALTQQLTLMAVASHQQISALIAIEGLMNSIGISIGSTISTAIWTSQFPRRLAAYLPSEYLPELPVIFGSLPTQTSFPPGTPARIGIGRAYGDVMGYQLIAALCFQAVTWLLILTWRNVDLSSKGPEGFLLA